MSKNDIQAVCKMFNHLVTKHAGEYDDFIVDWDVFEYKNPNYDEPVQVLLPRIVLRWK